MAITYQTVHLGWSGLTSGSASSAINTTGCDLLVVAVSNSPSGGTSVATLTDSKSNSWTLIATYVSNGQVAHGLYYAKNPTVGSGHTFTATGDTTSGAVEGFAGADLTAPEDLHNGNANVFVDSMQPGSLTPSVNDCVVVSAYRHDRSGGATVDSSFTQTDNDPSGVSYTAIAYKIQTTATAVNPTWTNNFNGNVYVVCTSASFKPATGGGGGSTWGPLLGLGNNRLVVTQ